jgi:hypothetical protein
VATSNGQALPVDTFREAAPFLRRPFTAAAVRFRILTTRGERSRCAAYIDARLAIERLNTVIPHRWEHDFVPVQGGMMCSLMVCGMQRRDVGWSKGVGSDMDLKALYSDAFKRAAVHFGIGTSLYAIPNLYIDQRQGHFKISKNAQGKETPYMTDSGEAFLRKVYAKWLDDHGRQAFGEPLDHGDVEEAAA